MRMLSLVLWIFAVVLFALSAAFDVLGGIGTICAAFFPENYPPLWPIIPYKWIYQIFVFTTLALGFAGVWLTISLIRQGGKAYNKALILLVVGVIFGAVRVFTSLAIRGKAEPTNINWYLTIFTLLVFLLFLLPGLRDRIKSPQLHDRRTGDLSASLSAISVGIFLITSMAWTGPSHSYQGENWAHLLLIHVIVGGSLLVFRGVILLGALFLVKPQPVENQLLAKSPTNQ
jgi:surface polysaccharide O-acyltransferase-like enzyme